MTPFKKMHVHIPKDHVRNVSKLSSFDRSACCSSTRTTHVFIYKEFVLCVGA